MHFIRIQISMHYSNQEKECWDHDINSINCELSLAWIRVLRTDPSCWVCRTHVGGQWSVHNLSERLLASFLRNQSLLWKSKLWFTAYYSCTGRNIPAKTFLQIRFYIYFFLSHDAQLHVLENSRRRHVSDFAM